MLYLSAISYSFWIFCLLINDGLSSVVGIWYCCFLACFRQKHLSSFENLEYLECINNKISKISNMNKLTELFISNNNLVEIDKLQNLNILNCTDNPIKKIKFFENISTIMCSTSLLSSRYKIKSINKVNNKYFLINIV